MAGPHALHTLRCGDDRRDIRQGRNFSAVIPLANGVQMTTSASEGASRPMKHIPTLDGWRGIAILMVLFDHVSYAEMRPRPEAWMTQTGRHGVTLFFVLSGYLITSNLLSQPISLKKFYVRRFFRLMPTACLFLAVVLGLDYGFGMHLTSWAEIRGCLLFYRNFQGVIPGVACVAGHFWSLSIEEQFYLVWPVLLVLFGARRSRWVVGVGAAAVASFRYVFWSHYAQATLSTPSCYTQVRADALLIGCLVALLVADASLRERVARISKWLAAPSAAAFIYAICSYHLLQPLWETIAIVILIAYTSLHPRAFPGRVLDWEPLTWLGMVSYSIYIWQQLFIQFRGEALIVSLCFVFPFVSVGSHYLIERPLRQIGRRLTEGTVREPSDSALEAAVASQ